MSFGAPLMLLGLLAAAIPVAVHLFNRRRAVRVRFPALELLVRSSRQVAPGLRIKRLALLALRVAALVLLPLAMAQPKLACGGGVGVADGDARQPASVVVLLDDSASMSAPAGGGTLYDRAAARTASIVRETRSWDRVGVITTSEAPHSLLAELVEQHDTVLQRLDTTTPGFGPGGWRAALALAAQLHEAAAQPARRTFIVTDLQAAGWPADDDAVRSQLGHVELIDVGASRASPTNLAVDAVRVGPAEGGDRDAVEVSAAISGWGAGAATETTATLWTGGVLAGSARVTLADGAGTATFETTLSGAESVELVVAIEDGVGATVDDRAGVAFAPNRALRVAIVDGDPRALEFNDEAYYLTRALSVTPPGRPPLTVETVAADRVAAESFDADVVVLANVTTLPATLVDALVERVRAGTGVWVTAGDRVDGDRWNATLAPLLPSLLRTRRVLAGAGDPDAAIRATHVGAYDPLHPIFRPFALPGGESLQSASVIAYWLVEPQLAPDASILASFTDGAPALLERSLGRGRVVLWTSTVDLDWTDLPIRTAYLPWVRQVVEHLARRADGATSVATVGAAVRVELGDGDLDHAWVTSPEGAAVAATVADRAVQFVPARAGLHTVEAATGAGPRERVADVWVLAPPTERDPTRLSNAAMASLQRAPRGGGPEAGPADVGRAVWPALLFAGLVFLYAESLVAVRRRVWSRLRAGAARMGRRAK
ncbi:MAG: VWA domain-containing protein [Myxococcales bacterium]|nr:VWA domain-containing protein [Myxococcales bacterium]